jgi:pimeloyl-ACP methyl ester carboxylesterase
VAKKIGNLHVPGAILYYKTYGSGPILLMIHGGNGEADVFNRTVDFLADHYTVVVYDRRGHSHSKLDDTREKYKIETHSDDAHRLLSELATNPAFVFGSSSGAVIALDLAAKHPEQVRLTIPHEPPLIQLLPDAEQSMARQMLEKLEEDYHSEGPIPAVNKFNQNLGMDFEGSFKHMNREQLDQLICNIDYFLSYEEPAIRLYKPDMAAIKSSPTQILPAGGSSSKDFFPYHCTIALSDYLGIKIVEFPGNHIGYITCPKEFAIRLIDVLNLQN